MLIYIDADYKCHTTPADDRREFEVESFNGKSPDYIEGYRYIPAGESWIDTDGVVYEGKTLFPWVDTAQLDAAQHAYERLLADVSGAYRVGVDSI